ncbi:uncharacterized protein LOC125659586 isoform X2 [Ostrea edulis]|uniref:uncharacterized protein LOC125659586 isoform X2 n=1 Tax=Ostrea edulis TaxID=37623 RepID=UPI0024AFE693|nr:uncharacterized protein LOC125659586 isoform X2 [Ostrea edulis]
MMGKLLIFAVLWLLYLTDDSHADYCLTYYSNNINTYYMYCADGCCGYAQDRECCKKTNAGAIAGGVIGALTAIAIVAGIIGYCYISKKKKKKEEEEMDEGFDFNMSEPEPGYLNQGFPGAPMGPPPAYDHPPPAPIGARGGPGDLPAPMPNSEHM